MTIEWTPDRMKVLIALWNEGLPTAEIGRRLGITKNAVVGKAYRLQLPRRQTPTRRAPKVADVVSLENLGTDMCSWPSGEPGTPEFHFCGKPAVPDKPYCARHCDMAYVRTPREKKGTQAA